MNWKRLIGILVGTAGGVFIGSMLQERIGGLNPGLYPVVGGACGAVLGLLVDVQSKKDNE